jgi:hypothetical protein
MSEHDALEMDWHGIVRSYYRGAEAWGYWIPMLSECGTKGYSLRVNGKPAMVSCEHVDDCIQALWRLDDYLQIHPMPDSAWEALGFEIGMVRDA